MMKKGQMVGLAATIIGIVLAVVILVNLAFPQVRLMYQAQADTDALTVHVKDVANTTTTLQYTDLVVGGVSIAGLSVANYTVDYDTAVVEIDNATANGSYTAAYTYYAAGYIESIGTRAFAAVLVLFLIVGLAAGVFKMFGLL